VAEQATSGGKIIGWGGGVRFGRGEDVNVSEKTPETAQDRFFLGKGLYANGAGFDGMAKGKKRREIETPTKKVP